MSDNLQRLIFTSQRLGTCRYGYTYQNDDFKYRLSRLANQYGPQPQVWKKKLEQFIILANLSDRDLIELLESV